MSDVIDIKTPTKKSLNTYILLPVTMQHFEDLTNDILIHVNEHMAPHALDAEYLAQVLMSAIHAIDHKTGRVRKEDLFEACINRVSCHVTYAAVQAIQERIKAKAKAEGQEPATTPLEPRTPETDILPDEAVGAVVCPAPPAEPAA
jgi:hypothetical protein